MSEQAILTVKIWTDGEHELPEKCDLPELFEPHLEHIQRLCGEGYIAGEVCDEHFRGWWEITKKEAA